MFNTVQKSIIYKILHPERDKKGNKRFKLQLQAFPVSADVILFLSGSDSNDSTVEDGTNWKSACYAINFDAAICWISECKWLRHGAHSDASPPVTWKSGNCRGNERKHKLPLTHHSSVALISRRIKFPALLRWEPLSSRAYEKFKAISKKRQFALIKSGNMKQNHDKVFNLISRSRPVLDSRQ